MTYDFKDETLIIERDLTPNEQLLLQHQQKIQAALNLINERLDVLEKDIQTLSDTTAVWTVLE